MTTKSKTSASGTSLSRFYVVIWLALGAAGIFYLTIASLAPEQLRSADAGTGGNDVTNQRVAALTTTVNAVKAAVDQSQTKQVALTTGLETLRADVGNIKNKIAGMQTLAQSSAATTLDGKPLQLPAGKVQSQAIAAKQKAAAVPQIEGEVVQIESPDPNAAAALSSESDDAVLPPVKAPLKPAKVASVAPTTKEAAKPVTPSKPYAINLAVSTSPDALRQMWQLFKDQHGALLDGLKPHSATSGGNVRLLAGPFASQAAATSYCAKLVKEGMACSATPMAGTPL
jgi:SPOR domain